MSNFGDVISVLWALFGIMKHNINFLVLSTGLANQLSQSLPLLYGFCVILFSAVSQTVLNFIVACLRPCRQTTSL